jgi:light-regulated signal transduction histidine kinase (bacteriophytochrome)
METRRAVVNDDVDLCDSLEVILERAGNAREIEREGTGLGLSLAKHTVELHGGTIDFSSAVGCGTTFRIALPAAIRRSPADPVMSGMESCGLCG